MSNLSLHSLASGSSGNAFLLKYNNTKILIDAGISCQKMEGCFKIINEELKNISGIVITHTHSDHIQGLGPISRKYKLPIYMTEKGYNSAKEKNGKIENIKFINGQFDIAEFHFDPFVSPHDSEETLNFVININNKKISYISDTGYVTQILLYKIENSDIIIIESNYDKKMLIENNTRPWSVKQRILGRNGHLSNDDVWSILKKINIDRLTHLFLIHISKDHNNYDYVKNFFETKIRNDFKKEISISVCKQDEVKSIIIE